MKGAMATGASHFATQAAADLEHMKLVRQLTTGEMKVMTARVEGGLPARPQISGEGTVRRDKRNRIAYSATLQFTGRFTIRSRKRWAVGEFRPNRRDITATFIPPSAAGVGSLGRHS